MRRAIRTEEAEAGALCDSVIATAQAEVEHLEMAYYRDMVAGASLVGQAEAAHLLRKNLD